MIVGDDGIIVVDTGISPLHSQRLLAEFRKISDKPVRAIIFTHGHPDHTNGARVFVGNDKPDIWARIGIIRNDAGTTQNRRSRGVLQAAQSDCGTGIRTDQAATRNPGLSIRWDQEDEGGMAANLPYVNSLKLYHWDTTIGHR